MEQHIEIKINSLIKELYKGENVLYCDLHKYYLEKLGPNCLLCAHVLRKKWTDEEVKKCFLQKGLICEETYINTKMKLKYTCFCQNICYISLDNLLRGYIACKSCSKQLKKIKCLKEHGVENYNRLEEVQEKRKNTCLEKYGTETTLNTEDFKEKTKNTCLKKYGIENANQSDVVKEKRKKTCLKKYGVENATQSDIVKEKTKNTCLKKYGVESATQSDAIKEKMKVTCLEKYGVENPYQSDVIKEKMKVTCLEKYGVEYPTQSDTVKEKTKNTCLKNYGVEYPTQSDIVKEKTKSTYKEKYGVDHPMHLYDFFYKNQHASFSLKDFTLPSGKIIKYQGYENFFIQQMLDKNIAEEEIINSWTKKPVIKYYFDGVYKIYHPDGYIESENKIVEIKSIWTYKKDYKKNMAKIKACLDQGYKIEFIIYTQDGKQISLEEVDVLDTNFVK
jgi:hypothetical protein